MQIFVHLPLDEECLVKVGQKVDFETPFYKKKARSVNEISISDRLHIPPKKIFSYLKKFVGDQVDKGEILAEKKGLLSNNILKSPYQGIIREINHEEGKIIIESSKDMQIVKAYFKGEINSVKKNQVSVEVGRGESFELKHATSSFGGSTFYLKNLSGGDLQPTDRVENTIVIGDSLTSYLQTKMDALGMKGIITLKNLNEQINLPTATVKNIDDLKKMYSSHFPYCVVDETSSKMYTYEQ